MWPQLAVAESYLFTAWEHPGVLYSHTALWTHIQRLHTRVRSHAHAGGQGRGLEATVKIQSSFKVRAFGGEWS